MPERNDVAAVGSGLQTGPSSHRDGLPFDSCSGHPELRRGVKAVTYTMLIVAASIVAATAQAPAPAANWSQFRGTARLSGVAASAPAAALALKWTYDAGESVESSAAIVDGA